MVLASDWLVREPGDIQLPGVDGRTPTRRIRADERHRHLPIPAVTAYARARDEAVVRDASCSGLVSQPSDARAPSDLLERLLSRSTSGPS